MFSTKSREQTLEKMTKQELDVFVIGGGITGAGIALDAASRGMKVALVEMNDFGAGTSSRSTKLVHGGLRYLRNFEIKMVADVGRERAIVYENGPHVTIPERMLLPIYKKGMYNNVFMASIGISVYDFLAQVKKGERKEVFSREKTLELVPFLKQEELKGSVRYVEYRTDDGRLTLDVMKKAVELGASCVNYAKAEELLYNNSKIIGVKVIDQISGEEYTVKAKKIINATGPWVDSIRELDNSLEEKHIYLTKGIHLVFSRGRFPLDQAVYSDTSDGRMLFAIPRDEKIYVGTTDTPYDGDIAHPVITKEDREYVINAINFIFPELKITEADIESSWAGLRPLIHEKGKSPSEISRRDEIWVSKSGLITIAGGKLTGYRKMAEHIIDKVAKLLQTEYHLTFDPCHTKDIPISGGTVGGSKGFEAFLKEYTKQLVAEGLTEVNAKRLIHLYGSNIKEILNDFDEYREHAKKADLPLYMVIPLVYGQKNEMMVTPSDYFLRRFPILLFNIDEVNDYKKQAVEYMSILMDWDESTVEKYITALERDIIVATSASQD